MKYPTIVVDNFFDNPNEIVEYSKTLDYYKADPTIPHSKWQGKRTESIHKINRQLYDFVISKARTYNKEFKGKFFVSIINEFL